MEDSSQKYMEASASPQMQSMDEIPCRTMKREASASSQMQSMEEIPCRTIKRESSASPQMLNPLQTEYVRLRALEPRDVDVLYQWENDTDVWVVSNTMVPFSKFTLQEYIKTATMDIYASRQLRLMIEDLKGHLVGAVDIFDFEPFHQRAGIGILIAKEYRHNGYAEEAVYCVCQYLFSVFQLHQVYCNILADNEISLKLFQRLGFQFAGQQKDWMRCKNKFTDVYILQLINENER